MPIGRAHWSNSSWQLVVAIGCLAGWAALSLGRKILEQIKISLCRPWPLPTPTCPLPRPLTDHAKSSVILKEQDEIETGSAPYISLWEGKHKFKK